MKGKKQRIDHSINGCAVICLLVISLFFSGVFGADFIIEIARIINSLCQPILQQIRGTSSYEFVTFQVAFEAMQALGLLPVRKAHVREHLTPKLILFLFASTGEV
jgi:hypothetical protein